MTAIRRALPLDLPGAYRVCLLTGDSGRDGTHRFRNPDLIGHVYVGPYIVGRPDLALVAVDAEGVSGYCLAAPDTRAFEAWCEREWFPALRAQYPFTDDPSPDGDLVRLIHAPAAAPDAVVREFPAHLHIDLLERTRGQGTGRAMVERNLATLRSLGAPGLHLDVVAVNANAIAFYEHLGFHALERRGDSLFMGMELR
jgi:GNAT superfamily N-acetyltransferase